MRSRGKTAEDLVQVLGSAGAHGVLGGVHPLSLDHVRRIRTEWGVPAAALI
jgi:antitoxin component HigA of HigAB toxin-antitoxin module